MAPIHMLRGDWLSEPKVISRFVIVDHLALFSLTTLKLQKRTVVSDRWSVDGGQWSVNLTCGANA
jgi:hypothetical protein